MFETNETSCNDQALLRGEGIVVISFCKRNKNLFDEK